MSGPATQQPEACYKIGVGGGDAEHWASEENSLCFLLVGKTGSGKSSTGNTILGKKLFPVLTSFSSVTKDCDRQVSIKRGIQVEIVDSPGLYDTNKTPAEICINIVQTVTLLYPGPRAILYVIYLNRYTAEDFSVYKRLKALFDENICKYMIVVVTGGDNLEKEGRTLENLLAENLPGDLQQVLKECNNRCILFNNFAEDPDPQVERLFDMVRTMVEEQDGDPYKCSKYDEIDQNIEAEVERRVKEFEERELKQQQYVQQLEQEKQQAVNDKEKAKDELQKKELELEKQASEEAIKLEQLEEQVQAERRQKEELSEKFCEEIEEQERKMKEKEIEMTQREKQKAEEYAQKSAQQKKQHEAKLKQQQEEHQMLIYAERREIEEELKLQRKEQEERDIVWRMQIKEVDEMRRQQLENLKRQMTHTEYANAAVKIFGSSLMFVNAVLRLIK